MTAHADTHEPTHTHSKRQFHVVKNLAKMTVSSLLVADCKGKTPREDRDETRRLAYELVEFGKTDNLCVWSHCRLQS